MNLPNHAVVEGLISTRRHLAAESRLVPVSKATMADFMRYYDVTLMNPKVLVGMLIGSMSVFVFCALTMKAVGRAAKGMVEEVRRQFREKPGIMQGTDIPDYAAPVAISTKAAQREMVLPSLLALIVPVATGMVLERLGRDGLAGGRLVDGFLRRGLHGQFRRRLGQRQEAYRRWCSRRQGHRCPQGGRGWRHRRRSVQRHQRPQPQHSHQADEHGQRGCRRPCGSLQPDGTGNLLTAVSRDHFNSTNATGYCEPHGKQYPVLFRLGFLFDRCSFDVRRYLVGPLRQCNCQANAAEQASASVLDARTHPPANLGGRVVVCVVNVGFVG